MRALSCCTKLSIKLNLNIGVASEQIAIIGDYSAKFLLKYNASPDYTDKKIKILLEVLKVGCTAFIFVRLLSASFVTAIVFPSKH